MDMPKFPLDYVVQVGYLGLYRADEEATSRNGLKISPPYRIVGMRFVAERIEGEWNEATGELDADSIGHPAGWEYQMGRITVTGRALLYDWFSEAMLIKAGYEPPASPFDRMRGYKSEVQAADQREIEELYTETQGGE